MSALPVILAVDDEPRLLRFLCTNLELAGYHVITAESGAKALHAIETEKPDLVLLDLGMPDIDGLDVLDRVRSVSAVPVIILTARDGEEEKVRGLEQGADDYLTKPFGSRELQARIAAVLRRVNPAAEPLASWYVNGDLRVDLGARTVWVRGDEAHLSRTEYRLLCEFIDNPDRVLSHEYLLAHVWGPDYAEDRYVLRVAVWRLRKKIEQDPGDPIYIVNEPAVGYRLVQHGRPDSEKERHQGTW